MAPDGQLPLVIPLVLYNGEGQWWAPRELAELIEKPGTGVEGCVPRLLYLVVDKGRYSLKDLETRKSIPAQIFWLEKNTKRKALVRGAKRLVPLLSGPDDGPLRRDVLAWFDRVLMPRGRRRPIPQVLELEDFRVMLEQRVEEWNRELREEGRLLGLKEGRQEGEARLLLRQLERKFGRIDPKTRRKVTGADAERLLHWGERVLTAERLEDVFDN